MRMFEIKHTKVDAAKMQAGYRCGIIMPVYKRYLCLRITLFFLRFSWLKNCLIIFLDDATDDSRVIKAVHKFRHKQADTMIIRRRERPAEVKDGNLLHTLHHNLAFAMEYLWQQAGCQYVTVLDSDVIVKPRWLKKMLALYERLENHEPLIVSGFNTISHNILKEEDNYCHKDFLGGISMLFNRYTYDKAITPLKPYWDDVISSHMQKKNLPMICTKPSYVQHIGFFGYNSYLLYTDFAYDFFSPAWLWRWLDETKWKLAAYRVKRRKQKQAKTKK